MEYMTSCKHFLSLSSPVSLEVPGTYTVLSELIGGRFLLNSFNIFNRMSQDSKIVF
jgi:hypothetical protein